MSYCANCQEPAPEGERLCGPCFNADFTRLTGRLKDPRRVIQMIPVERINRDLKVAKEDMAQREVFTYSNP